MPLVLLLTFLIGAANAGDRAEKLAARATALYDVRKLEPARKAATKSLAVRENLEALSVLLLIELDDFGRPLDVAKLGKDAAQAEMRRRLGVLDARIAQLELVQPNSVAVGIVRTTLKVRFEGELLPALAPVCPAEAVGNFNKAEAAFGKHDLRVALTAYDAALAACPDEPTWWTYSGDALKGMGDLRGAVARYEHALTVDPCHHVAHRFAADTLLGVTDLTEEEKAGRGIHAIDAVVCNPHYDAGWGTLGALFKGSGRVFDLRLQDPQGYELLRSRTVAGEGDALDRRVAAANAILEEGPPDTPMWVIFAIAKKADALVEAVAFETLDEEIAEAYRARRLGMREGLRGWVVVTRMRE
jgi:tetratricopeptide (TPR) repeat protein